MEDDKIKSPMFSRSGLTQKLHKVKAFLWRNYMKDSWINFMPTMPEIKLLNKLYIYCTHKVFEDCLGQMMVLLLKNFLVLLGVLQHVLWKFSSERLPVPWGGINSECFKKVWEFKSLTNSVPNAYILTLFVNILL